MLFKHEFVVKIPIENAWELFTDLERVAPCLPGAKLTGSNGDSYEGVVKVKVGPLTAQYSGTARFLERDADRRRAVIVASGRDTRGQGAASATVTAQLTSRDAETLVVMETDLAVTGKVAQFGRGIMSDVSDALLRQFLQNLENADLVQSPPSSTRSTTTDHAMPAAAPIVTAFPAAGHDAALLDVGGLLALPMLKRLAPVAGLAIAVVAALLALRSRPGARSQIGGEPLRAGAYGVGFSAGYEAALRGNSGCAR
jgi:uncharacterized protein